MTLPTWRRSNSVCVSTRTLPTTNPAPSTGSLIGQNWRSFYNASKPSVRHKTKCPRASWHKTRWRHWLPNSTVNCGHGPLRLSRASTSVRDNVCGEEKTHVDLLLGTIRVCIRLFCGDGRL